ncbi:MAG: hypothetical protein ACLPPF_21880 [Rhodomicrobium sp.]
MLGGLLRLIAAGEAGRRLGGYIQTAFTRFLVLALASAVFLAGAVFALLAGYWALNGWLNNPVLSAASMAAILASIGLSIALIASGPTKEKSAPAASRALAVQGSAAPDGVPTVEDVARRIEHAVRVHGPVRVIAGAAAGGLVAGLIARRLRLI